MSSVSSSQEFYFAMYMLMIAFGALHGLVFLPVLLSYIGEGVHDDVWCHTCVYPFQGQVFRSLT